jgi:hypothetical protein
VVSGRAPSGGELTLSVGEFRFDFWGDSYNVERHPNVNAGQYSFDCDSIGIDLKGGAGVNLDWQTNDGTIRVERVAEVPFLFLTLGQPDFFGATLPGELMKVTLSDSSTIAVARGVGSYRVPEFDAMFLKPNGAPYSLRGGEHLSAPNLQGQTSFNIPQVNGSLNASADKVHGRCLPNGRVSVFALSLVSFDFGEGFATAAGDGSFSIDFSSQLNLRNGDEISIVCFAPGGDMVEQDFVAGGGSSLRHLQTGDRLLSRMMR